MKIIHDGDHGGDDFAATLFAVGRPDVFDLQGVVTCHGNITVRTSVQECACLELAFGFRLLDAFGGNGIGGVEIPLECRSGFERIVVMGGWLGPLGPFQRCGNITPHAEFNFFMDPEAADYHSRWHCDP